MSVKLRISSWQGDRPGLPTIWESESFAVQENFQHGWISFDIPYVELQSGRAYVAWLSAVGLPNNADAVISIHLMGPRTSGPQPKPGQPWQPDKWDFDYAEGTRALWQDKAGETSIDRMNQSPWVVARSGDNLHFKMVFENKKH